MEEVKTKRCPLCHRDIPKNLMERHHIATKDVDRHATVPICKSCHNYVHALFSNKQIADELNTVEALLANEKMRKALKFIRKQHPTTNIKVKRAKHR